MGKVLDAINKTMEVLENRSLPDRRTSLDSHVIPRMSSRRYAWA